MNLIERLKQQGYDYLPYAKGDGVHDDTRAIQQRVDAGLDPLKECGPVINIKGRINASESNVLFDGSRASGQ